MKYHLHVCKCPLKVGFVAQITLHKFDFRAEIFDRFATTCSQIIADADRIAAFEEGLHDMGTDKAGAAGDEAFHADNSTSFASI